jgi:hypothetical protein
VNEPATGDDAPSAIADVRSPDGGTGKPAASLVDPAASDPPERVNGHRRSGATRAATALGYWEAGLTPIPLKPGMKEPAIRWKRWQRERPSRERVEAWWQTWPDANIGLITGRHSGLLVIDIDGAEGAAAITARIAELQIVKSRTRRGEHLYFAHPPHAVQPHVPDLPGVDVKTDGGYVVAPGSVVDGWVYDFQGSVDEAHLRSLSALPPGLDTVLMVRSRQHTNVPTVIPEGERNTTLTRLAGSIAARAGTEAEVEAELLTENDARCSPPLSEAEVKGISHRIWEREQGRRNAGRHRQLPKGPDVIVSFRWHNIPITTGKDLACLGYVLDLARLIATAQEMPIGVRHNRSRAAWVGAGEAEIAVRFLCNRWSWTTKKLRLMLEKWQALGLINLLPPRKPCSPRRLRLGAWVKIDLSWGKASHTTTGPSLDPLSPLQCNGFHISASPQGPGIKALEGQEEVP